MKAMNSKQIFMMIAIIATLSAAMIATPVMAQNMTGGNMTGGNVTGPNMTAGAGGLRPKVAKVKTKKTKKAKVTTKKNKKATISPNFFLYLRPIRLCIVV